MLKYFSIFYYAVPVQMIVTSVFVINGMMHYRKVKAFVSLLAYGILSLVQCIVGTYISVYTPDSTKNNTIVQNSINLFMLLECLIFSQFIISSLGSGVIKRWLRAGSVVFVLIVLYHWVFTRSFSRPPESLSVLESFLVIIGCLLYYFEIFTSPPNIKLLQHPPFWFITGMLLLFAFLLPLFLQRDKDLQNFVDLFNVVYTMNFIGYTILFIFFIIGMRCQIRK